MNFLEAQQQIKDNITQAMYALFGKDAGQITSKFDAENNLVTVVIQLADRIKYEFVYNVTTEELQCIATGWSVDGKDNSITFIAIPMSMSLSVMQQVHDTIAAQLQATLSTPDDAEKEAPAAQEE